MWIPASDSWAVPKGTCPLREFTRLGSSERSSDDSRSTTFSGSCGVDTQGTPYLFVLI
jgi:hypothetical protein